MKGGDLRIRPGRPEDVDALRAIRLEALADSPDAYGETFAGASAWDDDTWAQKASQNYYLAEVDRRVVGMARGDRFDGESQGRWLFGMYVAPSARGTGAAAGLVDAVSAWTAVEGESELRLMVTATMGRARAFYSKMGFAETGRTMRMHRDDSLLLLEMMRDVSEFAPVVREVDSRELWDLRRRVLRSDDPTSVVVNPADELADSHHFAVASGPRLVACASFFDAAPPAGVGPATHQLRYMATDFDVQGHGIGRRLLDGAFDALVSVGVRGVWAHARLTAMDFYRRTGWHEVPESLHQTAETGLDHVTIWRSIGGDPTPLR